MNPYRPCGGCSPLLPNYDGEAQPHPPPPLQHQLTNFNSSNFKPTKCTPCDLWSFYSYEAWISHLTSEAHQRRAHQQNLRSQQGWESKCSLMAFGKRDSVGIEQLALYLSQWGVLTDIIRDEDQTGNPTGFERFYVLYENEYGNY
jgi:hypothetical protein